jgi:flagellar biosynthesis protein FlhG
VAILDEHPAPGGISNAYGVSSRKDFKHVLHGDYLLDEIVLSPSPGLAIIPAARAAGMEFSLADEASLAGNIAMLRSKNHCIMVDCVHRTQRVLSPIARHADQLFAIVPANNEHLTQAYSLIKRIALDGAHPPIAVVVVNAANARQAKTTFDKLQRVALDHLGVSLQYQGAAMTPGVSRLSIGQARKAVAAGLDETAGFLGVSMRSGIADSVV